jgi:5'-nucleotidase
MNILLTNDDGVGAAGLEALRLELSGSHTLCTVAPDRERSATSHAVTLRKEVVFHDIGESQYSCTGTPADCVLYTLLGAIEFVPDIVISGINHGANLGTDIIYSGTVAAARQAALMKVPGIAVSLVTKNKDADFRPAAAFIVKSLTLLSSLWDEEHFININIPLSFSTDLKLSVSRPSRRVYGDSVVEREIDENGRAFLLRGASNTAIGEDNTDWDVVHKGGISISPIVLHPINHSGKEAYYTRMVKGSA